MLRSFPQGVADSRTPPGTVTWNCHLERHPHLPSPFSVLLSFLTLASSAPTCSRSHCTQRSKVWRAPRQPHSSLFIRPFLLETALGFPSRRNLLSLSPSLAGSVDTSVSPHWGGSPAARSWGLPRSPGRPWCSTAPGRAHTLFLNSTCLHKVLLRGKHEV